MCLFSLPVRLTVSTRVVIRAYEVWAPRETLDGVGIEVNVHSREGVPTLVFPPGALMIRIPDHVLLTGPYTRQAVLLRVAQKPGDKDAEYFANYTLAQLEFVAAYGSLLSALAYARYGQM